MNRFKFTKNHLWIALAVVVLVSFLALRTSKTRLYSKDGAVGIEVKTPNHPYQVTSKITTDKGQFWLKATTNLPDGTFYQLALDRRMETPGSSVSMIPEAGVFEPIEIWQPTEPDKIPSQVIFSKHRPFGRVKAGVIEGRVQFHPAAIQLFGCKPPCKPDGNLQIHVRVLRQVEVQKKGTKATQSEKIQWQKDDVSHRLEDHLLFPIMR